MEIKLTQNKVAIVDDKYHFQLNRYKWFYDNGYAVRQIGKEGKQIKLWMHWMIIGDMNGRPIIGMETDHINGNKLDNRKSNLRVGTKNENQHNRTKYKNNTSGCKGVIYFKWGKRIKRWHAQIGLNGKIISLGYFLTKEEASDAYDNAAIKYHKEFAKINKL